MPQLDLGHIVGLHFVNAEADHQIGHHFAFLGGFAHNAHRLVNVQQNGLKALQKMQALFLGVQIVIGPAAHTFHAEGDPLCKDLAHAQNTRLAAHQHIEVAGKAVLQRGKAAQLGHHLFRVLPAL